MRRRSDPGGAYTPLPRLHIDWFSRTSEMTSVRVVLSRVMDLCNQRNTSVVEYCVLHAVRISGYIRVCRAPKFDVNALNVFFMDTPEVQLYLTFYSTARDEQCTGEVDRNRRTRGTGCRCHRWYRRRQFGCTRIHTGRRIVIKPREVILRA